jgi:hypothetical protein
MVCSLTNDTSTVLFVHVLDPISEDVLQKLTLQKSETQNLTATELSVVLLRIYDETDNVYFNKLFAVNLNGKYILRDNEMRYEGEKITENFAFTKKINLHRPIITYILIALILVVTIILLILFGVIQC